MFLLTDPVMISINHIQKAQKQTDNGFNDVIAQLYQDTFKTQQKAKEEHIKQSKEKAIETERIEQQKRDEIAKQQRINEQNERERQQRLQRDTNNNNDEVVEVSGTMETKTEHSTSTTLRSDWSQVSPEQASQYMSARTGVSASTWQQIIYRESTNNPMVTNSIGCFGYLQLHPVHGNVSSMTPKQYLDTAVSVYNSQGLSAWEVVTLGVVN